MAAVVLVVGLVVELTGLVVVVEPPVVGVVDGLGEEVVVPPVGVVDEVVVDPEVVVAVVDDVAVVVGPLSVALGLVRTEVSVELPSVTTVVADLGVVA